MQGSGASPLGPHHGDLLRGAYPRPHSSASRARPRGGGGDNDDEPWPESPVQGSSSLAPALTRRLPPPPTSCRELQGRGWERGVVNRVRGERGRLICDGGVVEDEVNPVMLLHRGGRLVVVEHGEGPARWSTGGEQEEKRGQRGMTAPTSRAPHLCPESSTRRCRPWQLLAGGHRQRVRGGWSTMPRARPVP
jgi:hypothetical protein